MKFFVVYVFEIRGAICTMLPFLEKKNLSLPKSQLQLRLATLSEQCYSQRSQAPRSKLLYVNLALKPFLCSPVLCFLSLSPSLTLYLAPLFSLDLELCCQETARRPFIPYSFITDFWRQEHRARTPGQDHLL